MSFPDIRNVLATMQTNGTLTDGATLSSNFSITYDLTRVYSIVEGMTVYSTPEETAIAASAQGIGNGDVDGEQGYTNVMIQLLNTQYSAVFNDPNSGLTPIVDLGVCRLPYIDGSTHYTYHTDGNQWSIKYDGNHSILYGTVSLQEHSSTHTTGSPNNYMIEFPVSLGGAAGYATNFSTFTVGGQGTSTSSGDPFITPMLQ